MKETVIIIVLIVIMLIWSLYYKKTYTWDYNNSKNNSFFTEYKIKNYIEKNKVSKLDSPLYHYNFVIGTNNSIYLKQILNKKVCNKLLWKNKKLCLKNYKLN